MPRRRARRVTLFPILALALALVAPPAALAQDTTPGAVVVTNLDQNGTLLTGGCWVTHNAQGAFVQGACDGADGTLDGTSFIANVPPGGYELIERRSPLGYVTGHRQSVQVEPGQTLQITHTDEPGGQSLTVTSVDEAGAGLPGVCVNLSRRNSETGQYAYFVAGCDGEDGAQDGITVIPGIPPGNYYANHYNLPPGYVTGRSGGAEVKIRTGRDEQVTFTAPAGGSLTITVVDENGDPVPSSCFNAFLPNDDGQPGDFAGGTCDAYDGANDGTVTVQNLAVGDYLLKQFFVGRGHRLPNNPASFSLIAGENRLTIENETGGLNLVLDTVDQDNEPIFRACYAVYTSVDARRHGDALIAGCDLYDGKEDGRVTLPGLDAGQYLLVETFAQGDSEFAAERPVTLDEGKNRKVTIKVGPGATLVVTVDDGKGERVTDACFTLTSVDEPNPADWIRFACDLWDGNDGAVTLANLRPGDYLLYQSSTSAKHAAAAPQPVSISAGKQQRVTVENPAGGHVVSVAVVDTRKRPLLDACFMVYVDAGAGTRGDLVSLACDNYELSDGTVTLRGIPPGDYVLVQVLAAVGYDPADDQTLTVAKKDKNLTVRNDESANGNSA